MFDWLIDLLKFLIYAAGLALAPFVLMSLIWFCYFRFVKKMKIPEPTYKTKIKKVSFLKRVFILFPRRT